VLTDVNGDGILDIVTGNQGGGSGGAVRLWLKRVAVERPRGLHLRG
jgi:hypothetical protein